MDYQVPFERAYLFGIATISVLKRGWGGIKIFQIITSRFFAWTPSPKTNKELLPTFLTMSLLLSLKFIYSVVREKCFFIIVISESINFSIFFISVLKLA